MVKNTKKKKILHKLNNNNKPSKKIENFSWHKLLQLLLLLYIIVVGLRRNGLFKIKYIILHQ